jgi:hypothetical protein
VGEGRSFPKKTSGIKYLDDLSRGYRRKENHSNPPPGPLKQAFDRVRPPSEARKGLSPQGRKRGRPRKAVAPGPDFDPEALIG